MDGRSLLEAAVDDSVAALDWLAESAKKLLMVCARVFSDGVGDADFATLAFLVLGCTSGGGAKTSGAMATRLRGCKVERWCPKWARRKLGSCRSRAAERSGPFIKSRSVRLVIAACNLD